MWAGSSAFPGIEAAHSPRLSAPSLSSKCNTPPSVSQSFSDFYLLPSLLQGPLMALGSPTEARITAASQDSRSQLQSVFGSVGNTSICSQVLHVKTRPPRGYHSTYHMHVHIYCMAVAMCCSRFVFFYGLLSRLSIPHLRGSKA